MTIYSSTNNSLKKFIIGGILLLISGIIIDSSPNIFILILGVLNIVLGIIVLIIAILSVLHIFPKITINEMGLKDNRILKQYLNWEDIQEIKLIYSNQQNNLLITFNKQIDYSKLKNLLKNKMLMKAFNTKNNLRISLGVLNVDYGKLINILKDKDVFK